jgi:hypothetical protein
LFLYRVILTRNIKFDKTRKYLDKDELIEAPEAKEIVRVIEILSLNLYNKMNLVLEGYKLSIDILTDIIIVHDKIILSISTNNIISRYCPIRPIDALII